MTLKTSEKNDPSPFDLVDSAADKLLGRPVSDDYIEETTSVISHEAAPSPPRIEHTVIVFRLGKEWLALATDVFCEVTERHIIRRIPHRTKDILKGLVNLDGQLSLCIDLAKFLEVELLPIQTMPDKQKFVAIGQNQQKWVFPVDDILGLFPCNTETLETVPVNIEKSTSNYLKGICLFEGKRVSVLDESLLFYGLERRIA